MLLEHTSSLHVECELTISEKLAFCCHFPSDSEASSKSAPRFPRFTFSCAFS